MASLKARALSSNSISSVGADNADVVPNLKGQENQETVQGVRGARVLGDIGNRLKKNLVTAPPITKPSVAMKPAGKSTVGPLKATENFAVPKPPKAAATAAKENVNKPQLSRTVSAVPSKKVNIKQGVQSKVNSGLHNRTGLKPGFVKAAANALSSSENKPPIKKSTTVLATEKPKVKVTKVKTPEPKVVEVEQVAQKSKDEVPPEDVVAPRLDEETKAKNTEKSVKTTEVDVVSGQRYDIPDIDATDENNPFLLREYAQDIVAYLFALEKKYPIKLGYLEGRLVNSKMRAVLLDWLVDVHHQFGFTPETLYMAAKTLDRYLQKERKVTRKQLQLVGVTAMYVAAKFEEVCTPTVVDFSAVSDNAFSAAEVRAMEREMLTSLEYDLAPPPAIFFLRRFSKAAAAPLTVHTMAKYIMELTLIDYGTCHLYPSEQAAASLALALLIMEKEKSLQDQWTPTLEHYTKISLATVKRIMTPLVNLLAKNHEEPPKLKAIYNKYSRNRLSRIALIPELKLEEWKDRVMKQVRC